MKKVLVFTSMICWPALMHAQQNRDGIDKEIFNICATLFAVGLFMIFILEIIKRLMDNGVKRKIIDKGVSENLANSILMTNPKENRNSNIKWFAILSGLGIALTVIYYTQPLGIHSLAIMAFSLAAAFLGYFLFLRFTEK